MTYVPRQQIRYKVTFTPRTSAETYGSSIDVSDRILVNGIKRIMRSIDSGDYGFGVYTYGDIDLKGYNLNGYFNDENDNRSIFPAGRDLTKVSVTFSQLDNDGEETATIRFQGLINEEGTRVDVARNQITFRVLSLDSVIRTTNVPAGKVTTGMTPKQAIEAILDNTRISSVLTVTSGNINPDLNTITVDSGSAFDNRASKAALDDLLIVSNSVMIIDSSQNVIVQSREESSDIDVLNLYGPHDIHARENIITIDGYNTGQHRQFNSINVNDTNASDSGLQNEFGVRQKTVDIDFISDATKETSVANRLLKEFKAPKIELKVTVATSLIKDYDLLDRVSINYPLRLKPEEGDLLPIVGITKIGSATEPLPRSFGSIKIDPRVAFKIIEIEDNPRRFVSKIKLRQVGTELNDGVFNVPGSAIVGFAIIGEAILQASTDPCSGRNPSVVGAAEIGCTKVA